MNEIVEKEKEKEKVDENENEGEGEKNDAGHNKVGSDQDVMIKENEGEKSLDEKKDEEIDDKEVERTTDEDIIAARTLSKSNMEELVNCYFTVLNTERPSPPIAISPYASISRMGSNSNTRCPTRSGSGSAQDSGFKDLHAFSRRNAKCVDNNAVDNDGVDLEKESSWRRHSIVLDYAPTPRPASPSPSSPPSSLPNSRAGREEVKCPVEASSGSEKDSGFASGADEIRSKLEAIKIKSDSYDLRRLNGVKEKEQERKTIEIGQEKQNEKNSNEDMEKEKGREKEKEKEKERDKGDKMKWNPTALLSNAPIPVCKNLYSFFSMQYIVSSFPPPSRSPYHSLFTPSLHLFCTHKMPVHFLSLHCLFISYSTLLSSFHLYLSSPLSSINPASHPLISSL